ncbi:MAG TPA: 2-isopropylmalate synthase [Planctomycetes bacterium]|nr:2-isopropylmalate synthase [Planctomycetota bacterium]
MAQFDDGITEAGDDRARDLIHDWNVVEARSSRTKPIEFDDETLRDGLQSPSVVDPPIDKKFEILRLMDRLGIHTANVGLPGAGPRAVEDVTRLCQLIVDEKLSIVPNCAARTHENDIRAVAEISQKIGIPIECCTFIGSSPIRQYTEDWTLEQMLDHTRVASDLCRQEGLPQMYVTEDTTRAAPETLKALYTTAIEHGARRACVCDTVGHATPSGVTTLIHFIQEIVSDTGVEDVKIDWHGHRDRDLDVINSIAAVEAGADRIHGTAIGIGERCGNTSMDLLLVNLKLMGFIDNDLTLLPEYVRTVSESCEIPLPRNYPVFGPDAFETATGVHAAAVIKAFRKNDTWLANRVYSGVPADEFGLSQKISIGPMSGRSNVVFWLEQHSIEPTEEIVSKIFDHAKQADRLLSDAEIMQLTR